MPKLSPKYKIKFRRRREGKTNYKKRLKLLLSGKPRLVFRRSNKYIIGQIIEYKPEGDVTLVEVNSKKLKNYGWSFSFKNLPAAYLTGLMVGKNAVKKGIEEAILDSGLYVSIKGNKIYSFVKGVIDGGLKVPVDESVFPSEERIYGKHINAEVEKSVKEIKEKIMSG